MLVRFLFSQLASTAWLTYNVRQNMKLHLYLALALITVAGCSAAKPIYEDYDADIAPGGNPPAGFFVNPKFPGGESVMTAARRVLPDCGYLALSRFRIGADSQHDFVVFL
ncbi:MAG: hypothetical protein IPP19_13750 [Verrucomicrobia bacterium]|nr:hypothetical protein [Verrucomicrobiota bacterium]